MKKVILLTDTHFGCKNNSITWFNSQKAFIENDFIPYIQKAKPDEIIHLGDVFDIRSTVSVMIGEQVREIFSKIAGMTPRFTIIGGNHDYYSPTSDKYNSVSMILRDIKNLHIYSSGVTIYDHCMYLPWYEWLKFLNNEFSQQQLEDFKACIEEGYIKNVFTHADIWREDIPMFHSVNIFSGHIHTPRCEGHLYNLGSCYPLTFADSNQVRGFYEVWFGDDGEVIKFDFIPNTQSIRFWRFRDDEIFDKLDNTDVKDNDYIELYVSKQNLLRGEVNVRVNDLSVKFGNLWCIPVTGPEPGAVNEDFAKISNFDMKSMISNYVPDELREKFEKAIKMVEEN